jgi:3-oxoacyl-[acyl-carrier-protein] synthase II
MGIVSPLGVGVEENWRAMLEGRSGLDYITLFDASSFPTKIAGEVKSFNIGDFVKDPSPYEFVGRNVKFAVAAATMAWNDAKIKPGDFDPARAGIYLGSGEGTLDFDSLVKTICASWTGPQADMGRFMDLAVTAFHPMKELEQEPNMPAGHLASIFGLRGHNSNCLTACAASSQAIGEATKLIQLGVVDMMLSGGAHSMIHPLGMAGFNLLTALSTRNDEPQKASRPFDMTRDGFILGEGAGMLVLEELSHARRRGAHIHAEVIGYGSTADAFRITDTHPEGRGAIEAMQLALRDAKVGTGEIDYINAHGTSTVVNDKIETLAIKKVFGDRSYRIPVSSIKSMLGHLIAAAGAVELAVCALAMHDNVVPPTINYTTPDPDCDLDYVPNEAREVPVKVALSNSFGFGGQNVALVARKYAE